MPVKWRPTMMIEIRKSVLIQNFLVTLLYVVRISISKYFFQRRSNVVNRRCIPDPAPIPAVVCATPSPRPRCRIRTNPWLGATSPNRRRPQHIVHQHSLQCPPTQPQLHHAPYSLDSHSVKYGSR